MPLASSYNHSTTPRKVMVPPTSPVTGSIMKKSMASPATTPRSVLPAQVYAARSGLQGHRSLPSFAAGATPPSMTPPPPVYESESEEEEEQIVKNMFAATPRQIPFHEQLLEKGKLTEQRKEALRERAIHDELRRCKEKPTISKSAASKTYSVPIHVRAQQKVEQKKRDLEAATQAAALAADQESKSYSFKPKITKMGKMSIGKARDSADAKAKSVKRRSAYEQQVVNDLSECVFRPEINDRSSKLAERNRGTGGPHYTHADSLMDRSQKARLKTYLKFQDETDTMKPHNPCITPYAAKLDLNEDVVERLYGSTAPAQVAAACYTPPATTPRKLSYGYTGERTYL